MHRDHKIISIIQWRDAKEISFYYFRNTKFSAKQEKTHVNSIYIVGIMFVSRNKQIKILTLERSCPPKPLYLGEKYTKRVHVKPTQYRCQLLTCKEIANFILETNQNEMKNRSNAYNVDTSQFITPETCKN